MRSLITWILAYLVFFLTFKLTLPLQRNIYYNNKNGSRNNMRPLKENIIERTKKMGANLETVIRKIKDTTQNLGKTIYDQMKGPPNVSSKCFLNEDDLKHYEQLVIRKKYPYLDLKYVEMKLNPTNKNVRHDLDLQEMSNFNEPSVIEQNEESMNVEIFNRGLSGVAIPNKNTGFLEGSIKIIKEADGVNGKTSESVLDSLKADIDKYLKIKGFDPT